MAMWNSSEEPALIKLLHVFKGVANVLEGVDNVVKRADGSSLRVR